MSSKKSKAIPFIAGFFILALLAGFSLGLRTVIEFDPVNAQMKTSKYIFIKVPIIIHKQELWFSDGTASTAPITPTEWHLMHEIHHSATGTKIEHTHWGSTADTVIPWGELKLNEVAMSRLATRTVELINSDHHYKTIRIYARRIDGKLNQALAGAETSLDANTIDALFDVAFIAPTDAEANMIPDP